MIIDEYLGGKILKKLLYKGQDVNNFLEGGREVVMMGTSYRGIFFVMFYVLIQVGLY